MYLYLLFEIQKTNKQAKKKTYVEIIDEEINPKYLSLFVGNKTGKPQKYHM